MPTQRESADLGDMGGRYLPLLTPMSMGVSCYSLLTTHVTFQ